MYNGARRTIGRMETTDRRRLRGDRTRAAVLRRAVDVASLDGLERLSFGGLAADTGISKAGAQTLFGTKEALQLLVVEPGEARLRALIERWIGYAEEPLFAGGCFWVANLSDYDSRPGPVRDALVAQRRRWLAVLEGELRAAVERGEIAEPDVELTA